MYTSAYFVVSAADKPPGSVAPLLSFSHIALSQSQEMGSTQEAKQIKFESRQEKKTGELSRVERGEESIINTDITSSPFRRRFHLSCQCFQALAENVRV